jgi:uncharacterized membrane protein
VSLIKILSGDRIIQDVSSQILLILLPTFFMTSFVASLQALLEQLEQARRVLVLTVIIELLTVITLLVGWDKFSQLQSIMNLIIVFNVVYFIAFGREYWRLANKIGSENVL